MKSKKVDFGEKVVIMSLSGIGNSDIFLLKCLRLLPGAFLYAETLRTWCARVGNSPRLMPRQDESPAGWRGGIKRGMGTVRGGEELALLVMKTALASGMKNSLALVVKNGLSPMVKNALRA